MGASERTMDALYNEGNEIEHYVDDMLDDKDTSNAAAADGQSASTLQTQDPSFQSLHPSPNPSNVSTPRRSTGKIYTQKSYCFRFTSNFKSIEISRALQFSLRTYIAVERSQLLLFSAFSIFFYYHFFSFFGQSFLTPFFLIISSLVVVGTLRRPTSSASVRGSEVAQSTRTKHLAKSSEWLEMDAKSE